MRAVFIDENRLQASLRKLYAVLPANIFLWNPLVEADKSKLTYQFQYPKIQTKEKDLYLTDKFRSFLSKLWKRAMQARSCGSMEAGSSASKYYIGDSDGACSLPGDIGQSDAFPDHSPTTSEACGEEIVDASQYPDSHFWFPEEGNTPECIRSSTDLFHQDFRGGEESQGSVVTRTSSVAVISSLSSSEEEWRKQEIHSRERLGAIVVFNSFEQMKL